MTHSELNALRGGEFVCDVVGCDTRTPVKQMQRAFRKSKTKADTDLTATFKCHGRTMRFVPAATPPASPAATSAKKSDDVPDYVAAFDELYGSAPELVGVPLSELIDKIRGDGSAERPAQTCATCVKHIPNERKCAGNVVRPFCPPQDFGCARYVPAPPGPGAQPPERG